MSIVNPSQSSLSSNGKWVRPRPSSANSEFAHRPFGNWNLPSRARFGQWAMMFVAVIGLVVSGYLAWVSLTSSKLAGCGAGDVFDCGHVMSTKWSAIFGVPVSVPALFVYFAIATSIGFTWKTASPKVREFFQSVIVVAAFTAAMAAAWFISLQLFVVDHLCAYCLAAHACSLVIAGLLLWSQPITRPHVLRSSLIGLIAVGTLAALQFLSPAPKTYEIQTFETTTNASMSHTSGEVFQAPAMESNVFEAPTSEPANTNNSEKENGISNGSDIPKIAPVDAQADTRFSLGRDVASVAATWFSPNLLISGMVVPIEKNQEQDPEKQPVQKQTEQRRLVNINGGQIQLDVSQWPICGKQSAKTIGVEMFDYTCPHCRMTHQALKSAIQRSNHEFALVSLVVPMNSQCNPAVKSTNAQHSTACSLANFSVAVWRTDPTKYTEYHDWLFSGEHAPSVASAKSKAESLVGAERLQKELDSGVPQQYISKQCQLYQSVGEGVIPKIYIGNSLVSGQMESVDKLIQMINQH